MKNKLLLATILILIIVILLQSQCDRPEPIYKDNTQLFNKLEVYKSKLAVLTSLNDSLEVSYKKSKQIKDSVVYTYQKKYIAVYDTITNELVDCLPKPYVDTIITTYEGLLSDCDTLNQTKDGIIENLTVQNTTKDTIIVNFEANEKVFKKELKKQKRNKWKFGVVGSAAGYVLGKIF